MAARDWIGCKGHLADKLVELETKPGLFPHFYCTTCKKVLMSCESILTICLDPGRHCFSLGDGAWRVKSKIQKPSQS